MNRLIIVLSVLLVGCGDEQRTDLFILPDGYEGPVVLLLWDEVDTAYRKEDGKNIYVIPRSGILCVRSFKNFTHGLGVTEAMYGNGTLIPAATAGNFDDKRFSALLQRWSTVTSDANGNSEALSDPEILFFVGSYEETDSFREKWIAEEPSFKRH
ncbi:MAG: hypothetical protein AAF610_06450, partial [Pseudomonadota bacterium]